MLTKILAGAVRVSLPLLCLLNLLLFLSPARALGEVPMRNYCNVPPLPGVGTKPNLLLMIDNSASMYDLAYADGSGYCIDDSYSDGSQYPGYFDQGTVYSYSVPEGKFVPASPQAIPPGSSCNAAKSDYLCVDVTSGSLERFVASGRFLNWLAMSKLDVEKKTLTGGKYQPSAGVLQGESRGCQGKRFIKMLGDAPITFAVRGPLPTDSDYAAGAGGASRIELYGKRFKKEEYLAAVAAWQWGSPRQFQQAALACLDHQWSDELGEGVGEAIGLASKEKIFTQMMSVCSTYLAGAPLTLYAGDAASGIPIAPTLDDCSTRIAILYGETAPLLPRSDADGVCGNEFCGGCYTPFNGYPDEASQRCALDRMEQFCRGISNPAPTDPSTLAVRSGTNVNLPGFLLDTAVSNLGGAWSTLPVRVAPASAPTGILQRYGGNINFGAMVFNDTADGGKVISYINDAAFPLGDHGSGLIAAVDRVAGNSWTPLAGSFYEAMGYLGNRSELRLRSEDYADGKSPSRSSCQGNNILMLTDGVSTWDRAEAVNAFVADAWQAWGGKGMPPGSRTTNGDTGLPPNLGSYNLDDLAWIARNRNIADPSQPIRHNRDFISTYVVYTGVPCNGYSLDGSCSTSDEGVPEKMMQLVASKGGGKMAPARSPEQLGAAIESMLQLIERGGNSGTGDTIVSTGEANGALYLQQRFYPAKSFDGGATYASWIGEMQSLWYYIDPFLGSSGGASTIREDTFHDAADPKLRLELTRDYETRFVLNQATGEMEAQLHQDTDGDGVGDAAAPEGGESRFYRHSGDPNTYSSIDDLKTLWRAGKSLWASSGANRRIYTHTGASLQGFSASALDTARPETQALLQAAGKAEADDVIGFVRGEASAAGYRQRTLVIDGSPGIWKLGDMVNSAPQVQSEVPLSSYHLPAPRGYGDLSYLSFITSKEYQERRRHGAVYVGANDGMLHAFDRGEFDASVSGASNATLDGADRGKELWGFIPKNALPYLKYLADPNYHHLYYVDGALALVDASIGDTNSAACVKESYWNCVKRDDVQKSREDKSLDPAANTWRTVLIGGMGLGGASAASCAPGADCVPTPIADPADPEQRLGYSSYFALDVTDPANPSLLWEFSHKELGYATTGPAIVRVGDRDKNGRWFAVFGSGPTGPIDPLTGQFLGRSNQKLRFFVVDLRSGALVKKIETDIDDAFAGSMVGGAIDADRWDGSYPGKYQDDAVYVGYAKKNKDSGAWSDGGVLRILTGESLDPNDALKPWSWSSVIGATGPVLGGIARLQDRRVLHHKLWLYFGTGRYFYRADDQESPRYLVGVQERCYTTADRLDRNCDTSARPGEQPEAAGKGGALGLGDLKDQSTDIAKELREKGWYLRLNRDSTEMAAERSLTDPVATTSGAVFFTSFQPSRDLCQPGESYLWGMRYDTGEAIPDGWVQGKLLVPLESGEVRGEVIGNRRERRGPRLTGRAGKVRIVSNSGLRPLRKIIHIQER